MTEPSPDTPRLGLADRLAFLVVLAPYLWLVRKFWFVTDDAYITFRYSRNLARGFGPRFNLGEEPPVEGYSNFLWMLLGGLVEFLGGSIEFWPNLASASLGVVFLWVVYRTLRLRFELGWPLATVALAFIALHPPFDVYSTSGLATMPYILGVFLVFERLILRRGGIEPWTTGLACVFLALTRVDGLYWCVVLFALAAVSRRMAGEAFLRNAAKAAGMLLVCYAVYWGWRFSYYQQAFPNTVYAKSGASMAKLHRGLDYLAVNGLTQLTYFVSLIGIPFALRRGRWAIGLPVVAMSLAPYAYALLVGGDFMAMGRFLLPGWAFTTILFAWMLQDIQSGQGWRRWLPLVALGFFLALFGLMPRRETVWTGFYVLAAALAWIAVARAGRQRPGLRTGLACAFGLWVVWVGYQAGADRHFVKHNTRQAFHFRHNTSANSFRSEAGQWRMQCHNAARWGTLGRALNRWIKQEQPDARIVHGAIGAVSYYSELFLYDKNGLTCREVAQREPKASEAPNSPGHDKTVGIDFFVNDARFTPDILKCRVVSIPRSTQPSEDMTRQFVTQQVHQMNRELYPEEFVDEYATDFRPVPAWEFGGDHQVFVWWRRVREGWTKESEEQDLIRRLADLQEGQDPYAAVVEDGWPRPLTPIPKADAEGEEFEDVESE